MALFQLQSSSQSYEQTTDQIKSLLYLVSSQLHLPSDRQDRPEVGGKSVRRQSRGRRAEPDLTRRRQSRTRVENRKLKEKPLARSQSCAGQDSVMLKCLVPETDQQNDKVEKNKIKSFMNISKVVRSKSTAFEFRNVFKHKNPDNGKDEDGKCKRFIKYDSNPGQGEALRRIKTFLGRSRKYQVESEDQHLTLYKPSK